jgi:hypothetical protein
MDHSYDEDFFAWTRRNAELLRAGRFDQADIAHIAEEIEDLGKRDLNELKIRVRVLLSHLLEWRLQSEKKSRSCELTIATHRAELYQLLEDSPSLRAKVQSILPRIYEASVRLTAIETGLAKDQFPAACPFTVDQILDPEFLP